MLVRCHLRFCSRWHWLCRFAHLEGGGAPGKGQGNLGQATSLPRERVKEFQHEAQRYMVGGPQPPLPHGQARLRSVYSRVQGLDFSTGGSDA